MMLNWIVWNRPVYLYKNAFGFVPDIGLAVRVFANRLVEWYQRLKKIVLDAYLLNTQHYKLRIKGKVEQFGLK